MNRKVDKSGTAGQAQVQYFVSGRPILGKLIDRHTRCKHYYSPLDIIAIKFKCCGEYYPCYSCHEETADHVAQVWNKEDQNEKAVLCGACGHELTIREYLSSHDQCPTCKALFNPNCSRHYHLYFEGANDVKC